MIGILLDIQIQEGIQPVVYAAEEPQPEIVLIEVKIDWTEERIIKEINAVFPDAPIMVDVARCEGVRNGKIDPDVVNPTNESYDIGPLQISQRYHGKEAKKLGLDLSNPQDSIAFARILYDRNGLSDWRASKHCWSK